MLYSGITIFRITNTVVNSELTNAYAVLSHTRVYWEKSNYGHNNGPNMNLYEP